MKEKYKQTDDLSTAFHIKYDKPYKAPVRLTLDKDTILMEVYVQPAKNMLQTYESRKGIKDENLTYMDVAVNGIKRNWEKDFDCYWFSGGPIHMKVKINRKDKNPSSDKRQRYFKIRRTSLTHTSFVMSPPYRWLWGLFKSKFQLESFGLNWSKYNPGTINLNKYKYKSTFEQTAAHEFGHVLGLGDAYDAFYRFGYEVPGTETYMMNNNIHVNPEELLMVLLAHQTNHMQYFPRKFNLKSFLNSIRRR